MFDLFGNSQDSQAGFSFPVSLTEQYRPRSIDAFAGLKKAKELIAAYALKPRPMGFIFVGPSGTGKTTMGMAYAEAVAAEVHHVPSQSCTVAELERIAYICHRVPVMGKRFHLILVDEADQMSLAAQLFCLSKLDGTAPLPTTIWIFTCNETARFQDRFMSRNKVVEFSSYGIAPDAIALLERVWKAEAPATATAPNFARIVKESNNNVREALQTLETELMLAN